jgi:serine/threonine-protein kinase RsbW
MATLTVPSKLESLDDVRAFVTDQANAAGLGERRTYRLSLAVDEIATNIITYGYGGSDSEGEIHVRAAQKKEDAGEVLEIVLEDTSPPFDPFSREQPDNLDAPLAERAIGGLGIFLATENVDDFRYEHVNGRNRNIFIVRAHEDGE